jgi:GNAT superfamily N-acetyltransferase
VIFSAGAYELDDDPDRVDRDAVWEFLSTQAYWGRFLPDARGAGLGKELVATMIDRGPGAGFRWTLHTDDAHGLYAKFGFAKPDHTYLERPRRQALRQDLR